MDEQLDMQASGIDELEPGIEHRAAVEDVTAAFRLRRNDSEHVRSYRT